MTKHDQSSFEADIDPFFHPYDIFVNGEKVDARDCTSEDAAIDDYIFDHPELDRINVTAKRREN